ncbi:hypothetical protein LTR12_016821 [Friedmanniomyces endolithicus]|nr:hypothetical protein LTR12_016821 [Friedmanniomyces endolithicus]
MRASAFTLLAGAAAGASANIVRGVNLGGWLVTEPWHGTYAVAHGRLILGFQDDPFAIQVYQHRGRVAFVQRTWQAGVPQDA